MDVAIEYGRKHGKDKDEQVDSALDRLLVEFGKEILKLIPGRVSTEVDARFSFDKEGSVKKALHIIEVRSPLPLYLPGSTNTPPSSTKNKASTSRAS